MLKTYPKFQSLLNKYPHIYLIISPPRCSSTALARVFWEQPTIQHYSHEPFEVTYYQQENLDTVFHKLYHPLALKNLKSYPSDDQTSNSLLIKEMPYQVGENFPLLASIASKPIMFLIRDPRLNISSRISKKIEGGDPPDFPLIESGWDLLLKQIEFCEMENIPFSILDATDFRNFPTKVFNKLFAELGLTFSEEMLTWRALKDLRIDNLNGTHRHLYSRILNSTGLLPASEHVPKTEDFPEINGFRNHVVHCLGIYDSLRKRSARILPRTT